MPDKHDPSRDPVCGMRVDPDRARSRGLHSRHADDDYYFCGPGCKAAFDQHPEDFARRADALG